MQDKKKKYSALCCYFGKWPSYFQLWLHSCSYNDFITFIIVTDIPIDGYDIPQNVHIVNRTFEDVQRLIHFTFDKEIKEHNGKLASIERPYKLCEYKTAYGWLFQDLFKDYDYWGYYDIDLIWGDLAKFLPKNEDNEYVKIFPCGHLSFIKNTEPYNRIYTLVNNIIKYYEGEQYHGYKLLKWQDAFSINHSMFYDEEGGLEPLFLILAKEKGVKVYNNVAFDNILPPWNYNHFHIINKPDCKFVVYSYENGHLKRHYLKSFKHHQNEISYLHISKRTMKVQTDNKAAYVIYPNVFKNFKTLSLFTILYYGRQRRMAVFCSKAIAKLKRYMAPRYGH